MYFGYAGLIDRIIDRMTEELGSLRAVIATGGLAPVVLAECRTITHHEPMITLIGLRLVYERNHGS
jgi:type III pantothenate kinase